MQIDVAVPEMHLEVLTYSTEMQISTGARIIVEVQKHLHTGFVLGPSHKDLASEIEVKPIAGIIDDALMTDPDLWDLAVWGGKVCMCGVNTALRAILPKNFYTGEKCEAPPKFAYDNRNFQELHNFNPFDSERVNFYLSELEKPERTLMLFPTRDGAQEFYENLSVNLKSEAILWPYTKNWELWQRVNSKNFRIVIGAPGAVFAPLMPEKIIVEDEPNPAYILRYGLKISARSIAGRRAAFLGSTLILGGRMPSLKTYMRSKPVQNVKPERKDIVLADIFVSNKEELRGIDGNIPLTFSLIRRTYREIINGKNVMWVLNRQGTAHEIYCDYCGHVIKCTKCGSPMIGLNDGEIMKCRVCGTLRELPDKCEKCGHKFFRGKRPGIEALEKIIMNYYPKVKLYVKGSRKSRMKGLILTTHRGLGILGEVKPSLVAWLDFDAELWGDDYDASYNAFTNLYASLYAGRDKNSERKVLVQGRRSGIKFAKFLYEGWEKFLKSELNEREEFIVPPCGYMIELDIGGKIPRETIISILEGNGLFVMDPGEETKPLYVSVKSLDEIRQILEPYSKMLNITVRSE